MKKRCGVKHKHRSDYHFVSATYILHNNSDMLNVLSPRVGVRTSYNKRNIRGNYKLPS